MRQFVVTLAQNLGSGALGATLDVSAARVSIGPWRWDAEKELTKLSPGELGLKLADVDGSIWTWLQTQLGSGSDLLPPWLMVDIDGKREFTGTVAPSRITYDEFSREVQLTAQDWSAQLAGKYLGADHPEDDTDPAKNPWRRPPPKVASNRPATATYQGVAPLRVLHGSPTGRDQICFEDPANWLAVGDILDGTTPTGSFSELKVIKILHGADQGKEGSIGAACVATVDRVVWPQWTGTTPFAWGSGTWTRVASAVEQRTYYQVTKAVTDDHTYVLDLDVVDGLTVGDRVGHLKGSGSQSWTVLQVDAARRQVVLREPVRDVAVNDRIYLTEDSQEELVFEDVRLVLARAASPFRVDLSRYVPPTLPIPILVWLPLRPLQGGDLTSVVDLDAGKSDLRVHGAGVAWDGTPESGWRVASGSVRRAIWTDQTVTPPTSLMPDESATLTPRAPRRNRVTDPRWRRQPSVQIDGYGWERDDSADIWDPGLAENPDEHGVLLYDYLQMRRVHCALGQVTVTPWNGSSWGTGTTFAAPESTMLGLAVMPSVPGGILMLTSGGLRLCIQTVGAGTYSAALPIPDAARDAVLKSTPWGAYLVGSRGYGAIQYAGGALTLQWVTLADKISQIYPTTFCGLSSTACIVLGRWDALDAEGRTTTETWALCLAPNPTGPSAVIRKERVLEGAPRTIGALRDPTSPERVIGHCGGRLFQVSRTLPAGLALDRFRPSGMTAGELIEHICQVIQAIPVPTPDGVLHIVSRSTADAPIDLRLARVDVHWTRTWEHRYTCVRVSGSQEDLYVDVPGSQDPVPKGGKVLEVAQHPLLWTMSACEAMAVSLQAWFSPPRQWSHQTWVWPDPDTAAPWESLPPLKPVRLNGSPTVWLPIAIEDQKDMGEAKVTLLEVG